MDPPLVVGVVRVPPTERAGPIRIEVRLEDVTWQDRAATILCSTFVEVLAERREPVEARFELRPPPLDPQGSYTVRALADLDHDGQIGVGDLISAVAEPIFATAAPICIVLKTVSR